MRTIWIRIVRIESRVPDLFDSVDDSLIEIYESRHQSPALRETKRPFAGGRRRSVQRQRLKKRREY